MLYNIIYADPAWEMGTKNKQRVLVPKYTIMSDTDIMNLDIKNISSPNSALFLWTINAKIPLACQIINQWGFKYVGVAFCWIKTSQKTGQPNCRMAGNYTLQGMELCLLGIQGKMKVLDRTVRQVLMYPREYHSKKPNQIRKEIIRLFGDLPKIELFAREKIPGWDAWGNEIVSDITLTKIHP